MGDFIYRRKDTWFHRLSPVIKFLACAAIVALALLLEQPLLLLTLFLATFLIAAHSKILRGWLFYMKVSVWICAIWIPINLMLNQTGDTVLFQAPYLRFTLETLISSIIMAIRLTTVISSFAVLSLTTSPEEMVSLMSRLKLPAKSVFLTSLSARFFPSLLEDAKTLSQVQAARGARTKGIRGKGPVLIPLLSNSLERSVSVAEAMEARGFSGDARFYDAD